LTEIFHPSANNSGALLHVYEPRVLLGKY
jgi:hypothetical protein